MQSLRKLIEELIDDRPLNRCADDGATCVFCGAEWNDTLAFYGKTPIIHDSDCWIIRAEDALNNIDLT